ncbi:MAG: zinc finger domain-containing protein [Candidatus Methylarchaceae archaeon HK02M1]|nr:zinc finger domain-containing protein [Candidatus Methylarchaceae archaeon HK01M]MCP8312406.1 zinc finger domain-containing protein [Candidatus Methylarchaceae archaeon HK02M1]
MSERISLPTCTSCNRPIAPGEKAVKFYCLNCGQVVIWRCEKCRKFSRDYKCINCGFIGP